MTEWKDLSGAENAEELFRCKGEGWEIEWKCLDRLWNRWGGTVWEKYWTFRARPPQPKTKEVVLRVPVFRDGFGRLSLLPQEEGYVFHYLDEIPHRWEGGKLILEVRDEQ